MCPMVVFTTLDGFLNQADGELLLVGPLLRKIVTMQRILNGSVFLLSMRLISALMVYPVRVPLIWLGTCLMNVSKLR